MKILFLGSGAFGLPTLGALCASGSGHELVGVVTQPDRPAGRDRKLTATPVGAWAAEHLPGVPLLKPEDINSAEMVEKIRSIGGSGPDACAATDVAWIVIAYGQKLSRDLIDGVFAANLHGSLLPRWRGAAPINHAILAGDPVSGNSVITIADRMDAGLVLGQSEPPIAIELSTTAGEMHEALAEDGPAVVRRVLQARQAGTLQGLAQDESRVTRAGKLSRADGWIDFAAAAEAGRRRIHGLTPWPGVSVQVHRGTAAGARSGTGVPPVKIKLLRVEAIDANHEQEIGSILDSAAGLIQCGGGTALRLLEVQPAGKRPMTWSDFVHGHAIEAGASVQSEVPPPTATRGGASC